jgi:hypothetical protein
VSAHLGAPHHRVPCTMVVARHRRTSGPLRPSSRDLAVRQPRCARHATATPSEQPHDSGRRRVRDQVGGWSRSIGLTTSYGGWGNLAFTCGLVRKDEAAIGMIWPHSWPCAQRRSPSSRPDATPAPPVSVRRRRLRSAEPHSAAGKRCRSLPQGLWGSAKRPARPRTYRGRTATRARRPGQRGGSPCPSSSAEQDPVRRPAGTAVPTGVPAAAPRGPADPAAARTPALGLAQAGPPGPAAVRRPDR